MAAVYWRAELVTRIDTAIVIAEDLLADTARPEPNIGMLQTTVDVLRTLRRKVIACHVSPPDGQTILGIARGVIDFIDDLKSPLVTAAGAIETHYFTIPNDDQLPDFSTVLIKSDGTITPSIPDGQALVKVQNGAVVQVGIWRSDVLGGRMDMPINDIGIGKEILARLAAERPELLKSGEAQALICPADITRLMVWPEDHFPPAAPKEDINVTESKERFLAHWNALYPETPPINYFFKRRLTNRWARIYSLPDAKRYADTRADWDELERRQNAVIDSLIPQGTEIRIVCNYIDIDNYLFKAFDLENIGVFVDQDGEAVFQSFQFTTTWESHSFNPFLIMIAEEQLRAFIIGPECLIAPYDGGMDVILKDPHTCWAFKRQFKDWISPRPDGL